MAKQPTSPVEFALNLAFAEKARRDAATLAEQEALYERQVAQEKQRQDTLASNFQTATEMYRQGIGATMDPWTAADRAPREISRLAAGLNQAAGLEGMTPPQQPPSVSELFVDAERQLSHNEYTAVGAPAADAMRQKLIELKKSQRLLPPQQRQEVMQKFVEDYYENYRLQEHIKPEIDPQAEFERMHVMLPGNQMAVRKTRSGEVYYDIKTMPEDPKQEIRAKAIEMATSTLKSGKVSVDYAEAARIARFLENGETGPASPPSLAGASDGAIARPGASQQRPGFDNPEGIIGRAAQALATTGTLDSASRGWVMTAVGMLDKAGRGDEVPAEVRAAIQTPSQVQSQAAPPEQPVVDEPPDPVAMQEQHQTVNTWTPRVATKDEYDQLPSGTIFIAPDGTAKRKP